MPYKNIELRRIKQTLLKRKQRDEFRTVSPQTHKIINVIPSIVIKYKDGRSSIFTITPIILSQKDENTIMKIRSQKFL